MDQPAIIADSLADYLARHPQFAAAPGLQGQTRYLTSGDPEAVSQLASSLFGEEIRFRHFREADAPIQAEIETEAPIQAEAETESPAQEEAETEEPA